MIMPVLLIVGSYVAYRLIREKIKKNKIKSMIKERNWDFIGTCTNCFKKYKVPTDSKGDVDPDGSYLCGNCEKG